MSPSPSPRKRGERDGQAKALRSRSALAWLVPALAVLVVVGAVLYIVLPRRQVRPVTSLPVGPAGSMNVLVIGKDARALDPARDRGTLRIEREEQSHSDVIIICHINFDRPALSLVAVPRDLLVEVPGVTSAASATDFNNMEKATHVHAIGGDKLLRRGLEHLLGIKIQRSIAFDFDSFRMTFDVLRPFIGVLHIGGRTLAEREQALQFARRRNGLPFDDADRCRNTVTLVKEVLRRTWWLANTRLGDALVRRLLSIVGPDTDLTEPEVGQIAGLLRQAGFKPSNARTAVLVGYGADVTLNRYNQTLSCYLPVYREIEKQARAFLRDEPGVEALDFMTQQDFRVPAYVDTSYVLPVSADSVEPLPFDTTGMDSATLATRLEELRSFVPAAESAVPDSGH